MIWGVNDFDEAHDLPYTNDLVRLAVSALLAIREGHLMLDRTQRLRHAARRLPKGVEARRQTVCAFRKTSLAAQNGDQPAAFARALLVQTGSAADA